MIRDSASDWHIRCTGENVSRWSYTTFSWAIAFFVIALVAAIFGFGGLAASAAGIAKIIFIVALILAIVSFVAGRRPAV